MRFNFLYARFLFVWVAFLGLADRAFARDPAVTAALVAEETALRPGAEMWVGVRLEMDEHWHTYWINPGDAGLPTTIRWDLPEGFEAGDIQWPVPITFPLDGLVNLGYEDVVLLMVPLRVPADLEVGSEVELRAHVDWLECKDVCIPGDATVSLRLPVMAGAPAMNEQTAGLFASTRDQLPSDAEGWGIDVSVEAGGTALLVQAQTPFAVTAAGETLAFFPEQEGLIEYAAPQTVSISDGGMELRVPLSGSGPIWPETLSGIIIARQGWDRGSAPAAVRFSMPFDKDAGAARAAMPTRSGGAPLTVPLAVILAFIGGLILNLMPCVFPILSLRIIGFVNQAESDAKSVWLHGLVFGAGILVCFWLLAGTLLVLKAGGAAIGWGFQLQSPLFVVAVASLFLLLALNLFGVFEIGTGWSGAAAGADKEQGLHGAFLSGMLATIVATPCTAPFMGSALGFALAQPASVAFGVFTALGVGMAAPYLLLSRFPSWLSRIPKPGPWMESLKQGMGFVLLAFAIHLIYVYVGLRSEAASAALLRASMGLLLVAVGGWILGRWGSLTRETATRWKARTACLILVVGGTWFATTLPKTFGWLPYDPVRVEQLVKQGKPVFVDFTAKWCTTCHLNKITTLNTQEVQDRFQELGVTIMTADWTDKNEMIAGILAGFGRSGVPVYLLYGARDDGEPILLPEVLTRGIVLDALEKLNQT